MRSFDQTCSCSLSLDLARCFYRYGMEYSIVKRNISIYNFNRDLELWSSSSRLPAAHTCFNQLDLPAHEVCSFSLVQIGNNVRSFSDLRFRNALKGLELLNPVPSRTSPTKLHSEKLIGFCPDHFPDHFCYLKLGQASPAPTTHPTSFLSPFSAFVTAQAVPSLSRSSKLST